MNSPLPYRGLVLLARSLLLHWYSPHVGADDARRVVVHAVDGQVVEAQAVRQRAVEHARRIAAPVGDELQVPVDRLLGLVDHLDLTAVQQHDPVAQPGDRAHVVADEEDGRARAFGQARP